MPTWIYNGAVTIGITLQSQYRHGLTFSFTTTYDPINYRDTDQLSLALFQKDEKLHELVTVPLNIIAVNTNIDFSLDLWYGMYEYGKVANNIRLQGVKLSNTNNLGKEIIENGYFKVKATTDISYTNLTTNTYFNVGEMHTNSKKTLNFRLNIPNTAATRGLTLFGLDFGYLYDFLYSDSIFLDSNLFNGNYLNKPERVIFFMNVVDSNPYMLYNDVKAEVIAEALPEDPNTCLV